MNDKQYQLAVQNKSDAAHFAAQYALLIAGGDNSPDTLRNYKELLAISLKELPAKNAS